MERLVRDQKAEGSNPSSLTNFLPCYDGVFVMCDRKDYSYESEGFHVD